MPLHPHFISCQTQPDFNLFGRALWILSICAVETVTAFGLGISDSLSPYYSVVRTATILTSRRSRSVPFLFIKAAKLSRIYYACTIRVLLGRTNSQPGSPGTY